MANKIDKDGYEVEVLGTCMSNATVGSQHTQNVEAKYLWSYAQEEALVALSEQGGDKCWRLIADPERRAKRIAARYADLYFKSAEKSQGELQFYWPALAAFVVKDIVEAYRFAREEVLQRGWGDTASVLRNSSMADLFSIVDSGDSPYQHVVRTYAALAKGNLWLFMDIYPWLWYFLEYGLNKDASLNAARLTAHVGERDWGTFQNQSKQAVEELPFGPSWLGRLTAQITSDPVYAEASKFFTAQPAWGGMDGGYGANKAAAYAYSAHRYVKQHVESYDNGYRVPPSKYWNKFKEAYYVMESERIELKRIAADTGSTAKLVKLRNFKVTPAIRKTYETLIDEVASKGQPAKFAKQQLELQEIAKQEQINVLQPLIYEDAKLAETMAMNHKYSRSTGGWLSPQFKVVFSASPKTNDSKLESVFDAPTGIRNQLFGTRKVFTDQSDRMAFVGDLAKQFNDLMSKQRPYMDAELRKIQGWLNA